MEREREKEEKEIKRGERGNLLKNCDCTTTNCGSVVDTREEGEGREN